METFSPSLVVCEEYPPVTGGFPVPRDSKVELWCFILVSLNMLLNKKRHGAHMISL